MDYCITLGRLSWGCPILDDQLGGGVLVPGVTELSGVSAAGKTQLCLQLSLVTQLANGQGGLNGGEQVINCIIICLVLLSC